MRCAARVARARRSDRGVPRVRSAPVAIGRRRERVLLLGAELPPRSRAAKRRASSAPSSSTRSRLRPMASSDVIFAPCLCLYSCTHKRTNRSNRGRQPSEADPVPLVPFRTYCMLPCSINTYAINQLQLLDPLVSLLCVDSRWVYGAGLMAHRHSRASLNSTVGFRRPHLSCRGGERVPDRSTSNASTRTRGEVTCRGFVMSRYDFASSQTLSRSQWFRDHLAPMLSIHRDVLADMPLWTASKYESKERAPRNWRGHSG